MNWKQFLNLLKKLKFQMKPMIISDHRPRVPDSWIPEQRLSSSKNGDEL